MSVMTKYEQEVICNIIYAVETGGQVYGNKDYDSFIAAGTNTSNEVAITIGAGQWYATEAQRLLKLIREKDPEGFKKLDTAGIGDDLDNANWSNYKVSKGSAKAVCIQKIIDTEVGHQVQDQLVVEQMEKYVQEAAQLGVTDMDAKMMCANFRHQGGLSAMKRVIGKTKKPYTLDNLYAACSTDTGNQVGAYRSRQKFVYNTLKKYITNKEQEEQVTNWKATGTLVCTVDIANVYKSANTNTTIGQIAKGNRVEIDGTKSNGFTHVKVGNNIGVGWIKSSNLGEKVEESTTNNNTSNNTQVSSVTISKIKEAQRKLNTLYKFGLEVDGSWGPKSKEAYIKAVQKALNSQYNEGLSVDGAYGPKTKAAVRRHVLRKGMYNNTYVKILQIGLYAHDISLVSGIDGDFGASTYRGVVKFQNNMNSMYKANIAVDGETGIDAFTYLITK